MAGGHCPCGAAAGSKLGDDAIVGRLSRIAHKVERAAHPVRPVVVAVALELGKKAVVERWQKAAEFQAAKLPPNKSDFSARSNQVPVALPQHFPPVRC